MFWRSRSCACHDEAIKHDLYFRIGGTWGCSVIEFQWSGSLWVLQILILINFSVWDFYHPNASKSMIASLCFSSWDWIYTFRSHLSQRTRSYLVPLCLPASQVSELQHTGGVWLLPASDPDKYWWLAGVAGWETVAALVSSLPRHLSSRGFPG